MTDRESRVRALAANAIATVCASNDEPLTDHELRLCSVAALTECARIIDAIDALPVPGSCDACSGSGDISGDRCPECKGSGKGNK